MWPSKVLTHGSAFEDLPPAPPGSTLRCHPCPPYVSACCPAAAAPRVKTNACTMSGRVRRWLHLPPGWQRPARLRYHALGNTLVAVCLIPSVAGGTGSGQAAGMLELLAHTARQGHRARWHGMCFLLEARAHGGPDTGGDKGRMHEEVPGAGLPHGFLWSTLSRGENHDTQHASASSTSSKPTRRPR